MGLHVRQKVDALLAAGASLRVVGKEAGAATTTVARHRDGCVSALRDPDLPIAPSVALSVDELVGVAQEAMQISIEIARAEQTERPGIATRAAASAAKIATDTLGLIFGTNKLIELEARIAILAGDEEGAARLRSDLLYPSNWVPPRLVKQPAAAPAQELPPGIMGYDSNGEPFPYPRWGRDREAGPAKLIPASKWQGGSGV